MVPAFNEGEMLEHVLQHAREWGYLKHLVVVDDASTDATHQILERWVQHSELRALRMEHNCKKEGAIRAAMEALQDALGAENEDEVWDKINSYFTIGEN